MATVRMSVSLSGCINGQPWPKAGDTIELPDITAEGLQAAGHGKIVEADPDQDQANEVETRPAPDEKVETRPTATRRARKR